jgi:CelD/BcsL family acetyltransferase involved in cellulose biosynthesis
MSRSAPDPSDREWSDFVAEQPQATVYHTLGWRAVGESLGHRARPLVSRDSDGSLNGVLPLFEVGRGRDRRFAAVPLRDRGGPLAKDEASVAGLMREAAGLARSAGAARVILRSQEPMSDAARDAGYSETSYHVTTLVDLSSGPEAVLARVKGSARRAAAKGVDAGLTFRWGSGQNDMRSFYSVFLRTRRRLGVPPHPWSFFRAVTESLGDGIARLGLASLDGKVVAGTLLLAYGDRVIDGYAASDERHLSAQPNDFLIWNALAWGADEGYKYFDFGASSPEQKGLLFFKEKWGGCHTPLYSYTWPPEASSALRDSNRPEYRLVRATWRRLPIWATRVAGPPIVRGLD